MPGWYPDPSGAPGRFRYWDGRSWSQQTSDRPGAPGPGQENGQGRRRALPLILGAVALAVVLGLIIVFVVRQAGAGSRTITNEPVPTSTVSGWDDSSPTATPTPSETPSPSPTTDPSGKESTRPLTSCPQGDPYARAQHPADGRVYGGGLSFPRVEGWQDDLQTSGVSWGYDAASQGKSVAPGWVALLAVAELRESDGFTSTKQAAQSVMQCVASSLWYRSYDSAQDLKSEAATIDGHQAWWIRTDIRVTGRDVAGDTVDVIVVDTGRPGTFGLFIGAVAIDHQDLLAILDSTTSQLTVD
jgi:hypothetical protein